VEDAQSAARQEPEDHAAPPLTPGAGGAVDAPLGIDSETGLRGSAILSAREVVEDGEVTTVRTDPEEGTVPILSSR
jgi:hypothetical protein